MSNFEKYEYWLELSDDDIEVAKYLLEGQKLLYCGYFCHLAVEKALKAAVARNTNEMPPKIHDLPRLGQISGIWDLMSENQQRFIYGISSLQIEARYPEYKEKIAETLSTVNVKDMLRETEEFICWIKLQLKK